MVLPEGLIVTGNQVTFMVPSLGPFSTCKSKGGSGNPLGLVVTSNIPLDNW